MNHGVQVHPNSDRCAPVLCVQSYLKVFKIIQLLPSSETHDLNRRIVCYLLVCCQKTTQCENICWHKRYLYIFSHVCVEQPKAPHILPCSVCNTDVPQCTG